MENAMAVEEVTLHCRIKGYYIVLWSTAIED